MLKDQRSGAPRTGRHLQNKGQEGLQGTHAVMINFYRRPGSRVLESDQIITTNSSNIKEVSPCPDHGTGQPLEKVKAGTAHNLQITD